MCDGPVGPRAQDQTHRWIFAGVRPVFTRVVKVEIHLCRIGMAELSELEVDDDQAAQPAVKEHQIDTIPLVANAKPPLPGHEREIVPKFQQERFEMLDQRLFQVGFGILALQAQEF